MGPRPRRPDNAEITIAAKVRARQLRFGEVPRISTEFSGTPGHESAAGSDRVHLPRHVEKDVTYRHVSVDYRLAAALLYPAEAKAPPARRQPRPARLRPLPRADRVPWAVQSQCDLAICWQRTARPRALPARGCPAPDQVQSHLLTGPTFGGRW